MKEDGRSRLALKLFGGFGTLAIVAGGMLSAFSASRPTELALWASAYLVLVVGVAQVGFGAGLYGFATKARANLIWLSFLLYNLGNLAVLTGTAIKTSYDNYTVLVNSGGVLLVLALLLVLQMVRGSKRSWKLVVFYVMVVIILISMPIGLILSASTR